MSEERNQKTAAGTSSGQKDAGKENTMTGNEKPMTEKEKMLAGQLYNTRDPEIIARRYLSRDLQDRLNALPAEAHEERREILEQLLGRIDSGVWIEKPFRCNYGENITLGENTFINFDCIFSDDNRIEIGKSCMFAPGVHIYTVTHPTEAPERIRDISGDELAGTLPYNTYTRPVVIGDYVWVGGGAIILPGVTIGEGAVIGAGSVVTEDIPEYCLAVGVPCRVKKHLKRRMKK